MNYEALLSLISDLYMQIRQQQEKIKELEDLLKSKD